MTQVEQSTTVAERTRVFIVDDHPIVRQGLTQMINQEADLMVCGEAEDAQNALQAVAELHPDLVLVDLSLKEGSGLDLIRTLRTRQTMLPVLVVSMHDETLYVERALRAGARGYIMKHEATDIMMNAIRRVLRGEIYVSDKMSAKILAVFSGHRAGTEGSPVEKLSDREFEVFQLIGEGLSTRDMARRLHLSAKTVEVHRVNMKRKLNLGTARELAHYAVRWVESQKKA